MDNQERPTYRQAVRDIQTFLYTISQTDPLVPRVNPDGIYGPETAEAVRVFQETYLGFGDGRVDFTTWQALVAHYRTAQTALQEPERIAPFTVFLKNGRLILGDRSDIVRMVRIMLATIGLDYACAEGLPITDLFDDAMEQAILSFQYANGLEPDGIIDRNTWDRLAIAYNKSLRIE
jgi:peptidoglycan hydrolase-like protein with peptidoglycan-binding domain